MKNEIHIPSWAWDFYQAKQNEVANCPNDAIEETLNYLERVFTAGRVPNNLTTLEKMVDNHLAGQRQKVRRRLRLLEENSHLIDSTDQVIENTTDSLALIRRNVTPSQWRLLNGLANGHSYRRLSAECRMTESSAKSSICRVRKRLRSIALAE